MRTFFMILCCMVSAATAHAACKSNIPASTPDSQLTDNGDGTVTDSKTGLMWKQCSEGQTFSGGTCTGTAGTFTWRAALQRPGTVNSSGFAGYTDWRLPDIRELLSIVEEQCSYPAINTARFPNSPIAAVWSGSPSADCCDYAWVINFHDGNSFYDPRSFNGAPAVRLVRGGQ